MLFRQVLRDRVLHGHDCKLLCRPLLHARPSVLWWCLPSPLRSRGILKHITFFFFENVGKTRSAFSTTVYYPHRQLQYLGVVRWSSHDWSIASKTVVQKESFLLSPL